MCVCVSKSLPCFIFCFPFNLFSIQIMCFHRQNPYYINVYTSNMYKCRYMLYAIHVSCMYLSIYNHSINTSFAAIQLTANIRMIFNNNNNIMKYCIKFEVYDARMNSRWFHIKYCFFFSLCVARCKNLIKFNWKFKYQFDYFRFDFFSLVSSLCTLCFVSRLYCITFMVTIRDWLGTENPKKK